jgi:hypothetical protein
MKQLKNAEFAEWEKYKSDLAKGRILQADAIRFICEACNFDAEKIGQHFLEMLPSILPPRGIAAKSHISADDPDETGAGKTESPCYRPYFDWQEKLWKVDFPDRDSEEGDLLYVASEFAMTSLYYPYNTSETKGKKYSGHDHYFEGVIHALLDDPEGFTIEGFEEYYSEQERDLLSSIQQKLLDGDRHRK